MRFPNIFYRAIAYLMGAVYIGSARASLNFASIAAGLQERLTITVTGALLGDEVTVAPEADIEAGLAIATAFVSAADTVTVIMANNTAGAIDPAACTYKVRVARRTR